MNSQRRIQLRADTAQNMAYSVSDKLSRQLQTVKTADACQDSCRLSRAFYASFRSLTYLFLPVKLEVMTSLKGGAETSA